MKQHVLFVDDEPNVLSSYRRNLCKLAHRWDMSFIACPIAAWKQMHRERFDTVVTDVRMPRMTGLELLERVKQNESTRDIPVIIVTGEADKSLKRQALELEATDLLNKPVDSDDLRARIQSALRLKRRDDQLKRQNAILDEKVRQRTVELAASRLDIIWRLGKAAEFRDEETGNHVIRVGCYSRTIAKTLGLDDKFVETIFLAAPLHDVGKIAIPDAVLLKPGQLSESEWELMRKHCEFGRGILAEECKLQNAARDVAGMDFAASASQPASDVLKIAAEIAESHHEKWDGTGYPHGTSKTDIPLSARIVAIADVYDALRSRRPYKEPFTVERCLEILARDAGRHFDPRVYEAFVRSLDAIRSIEDHFSDHVNPCSEEPCSEEPNDDQLAVC